MFHKLVAASAWVLFALIIFVTICPIQDRPVWGPARLEHLAAFAALCALFCAAYPRQTMLVLLLLVAAGGGLELAQYLTPDRHARLSDFCEKAFGGMTGIITTHLILSVVADLKRNPVGRGGH
jgi:uncharacterized membrane protein